VRAEALHHTALMSQLIPRSFVARRRSWLRSNFNSDRSMTDNMLLPGVYSSPLRRRPDHRKHWTARLSW
jgi:hypothetical protein